MKTSIKSILLGATLIFASACTEDVTDPDNSGNNNGNNNNPTNVTNNTVVIDGTEYALSKYFISEIVDGTGSPHYELVGRAVATSNKPSVSFRFGALPSGSTTWHFQDSSNNPALLESDEYWTQASDTVGTWYPEFTTTAFVNSGDVSVVMTGTVMTLSYESLELADNYITPNVTERVLVSTKISIDLDDFQGQDLTIGLAGDLAN